MTNPDLTEQQRIELFNKLIPMLENYYSNTQKLRVTSGFDPAEIRNDVRKADFNNPVEITTAVGTVTEALNRYAVQITHPMYYGLFNPRPNFPSIIADLITATYNPQLAAWSHSPWAVEAENYLISEFGQKIGFPEDDIDGVFATGGAEANITALLCALNNAFPEALNEGLQAISAKPTVYCSSESHHSIIRAAKISGLGARAIRMIQTDNYGAIQPDILEKTILADKENGLCPFMVIGTAGTTGTGSIDDLLALAAIASKYSLHFHIDAAWGGAALLNSVSREWLSGIELADSVTFDIHKWLSVPMSASMLITRHKQILERTFRISTDYMPKDAEGMSIVDPYAHSIQWSRRFTGLKLYLSMMVFGWRGYSDFIGHQIETGDLLRSSLDRNGWIITNRTLLPLVCFTDPKHKDDPDFARRVCTSIVNSGEAWVSVYPVNGINSIRACITNYNTTEENVSTLVEMVNRARSRE
jgi:glutamate/tyrosine decarboxylase-like PLP-dependent enzyme